MRKKYENRLFNDGAPHNPDCPIVWKIQYIRTFAYPYNKSMQYEEHKNTQTNERNQYKGKPHWARSFFWQPLVLEVTALHLNNMRLCLF